MADKTHLRLVKDDEVPGSKPNEPENEEYLDDYNRSLIAHLRGELAKIPPMNEEECLDVLIKAEGPDYVRSGRVGGSIVVIDKISKEGEETLSNVRDYLKAVFEKRIKSIKFYALERYKEAKKREELANNPDALLKELEPYLPTERSARIAVIRELLEEYKKELKDE